MTRSKTIFVDLRKLLESGDDSAIVLRLAMAANDLAVANFCLREFKRDDTPFPEYMRPGAGMYLVRLQTAHLAEAIKVLSEVEDSPSLSRLVGTLPAFAKEAYDRLLPYTDPNGKPEQYKRNVLMVRNKFAFHYDKDVVLEALESLASRGKPSISTAMRSTEETRWRFTVADRIADVIKCRIIWEIPLDANLREEADLRSDYAFALAKDLIDFVGEFAWRYLEQHHAI
jgi:hypothetical protein